MRLLSIPRPAREAAAFLAFLAAWTVLASFVLLGVATGPLRVAGFQGIALAWAWWSYLLAGAPHPLPWSSLMGLGPAVWPWLPSLFLAVSGFLAAMILGLPAWVVLHARGGLAR